MLRLPRKECTCALIHYRSPYLLLYRRIVFSRRYCKMFKKIILRPRFAPGDLQPLPNAPHAPLRLRLRCAHDAA